MDFIFSHDISLPEYFYLHYPLCRHHCSYCDFNVYRAASQPEGFNRTWIEAILRHLAWWKARAKSGPHSLRTLYLGGGTPSLLSPKDLELLLESLRTAGVELASHAEFTLEANPESLTEEKVRAFRSFGVNRISLGVQSFQSLQLKRLERLATRGHLESALEWVSKYFKNFSVDLMVGLPDQTLELLNADLEEIRSWKPPHLSAYILTLQDDHLWKISPSMSSKLVGDDRVEAYYLHLISVMRSWGYLHYEVSNFSKPGFESQHNKNYWNTESSYLGLGPGAHGYLGSFRYECEQDPASWMSSVDGIGSFESLSSEQKDLERLYLALRTRRALPKSQFSTDSISALQQMGLLVVEENSDQFELSDRGWLMMESVAGRLVS